MDIAGHDMLNSNQAVLSYLELIMAAPDVTPKTKRYAEKAVAHVRSSTMLVENIRRLLASRSLNLESMKSVNLTNAIARSERELRAFFPAKKITVRVPPDLVEVDVLGDSVAEYLVLNMLVTLVKLDLEEEVVINITIRKTTASGHEYWTIRMEDPNSQLPPGFRDDDFDSVHSKDTSVSVKITGLLFSKMIADSLGGQFDAQELVRQGERRGAALIVTLRRAMPP
jgi:hypothetical protein